MLPNNRVIDRGGGVTHYPSVGLKVAFAAAVDLFPVNDIPMESMQHFQKPSVIQPPVPAAANTDAIAGKLNDFGPATVELISLVIPFKDRLLLLETFAGRRYYEGTCYKAANWQHIGQTYGSTKQYYNSL